METSEDLAQLKDHMVLRRVAMNSMALRMVKSNAIACSDAMHAILFKESKPQKSPQQRTKLIQRLPQQICSLAASHGFSPTHSL